MAAVQGGRKFHEQFPRNEVVADKKENHDSIAENNINESKVIFDYIKNNVIGKDLIFNGPFGKRKVLHCDYTASARSLRYIEDYIQDVVLPHYGNSHTTTSVTSLQTTMFCAESRDVIRKSVNASENDAVIFTGSGCTAAVHKLIHALMFQTQPVVFVSPFEHHSNLLPWKEIGGKIVWTKIDANGNVDLNNLEANLKAFQACGRPLIGCFCAASNITGILVDTDAVAALLHKYNALAFFDYASAAPYVTINMNPSSLSQSNLTYKDAVFLSCHKFVGGPGTPGILVAKKNLFLNAVPSGGGGGSVFFVTENSHRYLKEIEVKEEGGTPDLIGSIRAGLVFQLKENVGCENILYRDNELLIDAENMWNYSSNLIVLGQNVQNRLPIFSFVIKHKESGRLLHHNYVSVLLNDLFGIQSRGGCACAGPYAQQLLGMSEDVALEIEGLLLEDQRLDRHHLRRHREYSDKEILRPGFTRINLPYFYDNEMISFILKSVHLISEHGWKLLPQYLFNPDTGEWKYRNFQLFKDRKWIGSIKYKNGVPTPPKLPSDEYNDTYQSILDKAENILVRSNKGANTCGDQTLLFGDEGEKLRWFLLPCESQDYLNNDIPNSCTGFHMPFFPGRPVIGNETYKDLNSNISNSFSSHYCSCSPLHLEMMKQKMTRDNDTNVSEATNNGCDKLYRQYETSLSDLCNGCNTETKEDRLLSMDNIDSCNNNNNNNNNNSDNNTNTNLLDKNSSEELNHINQSDRTSSLKSMLMNSMSLTEYSEKNSVNAPQSQKIYNGIINNISTAENDNISRAENNSVVTNNISPVENNNRVISNNISPAENNDVINGGNMPPIVKFHNPPKHIFSLAIESMEDFHMIQNNDHVLLCLSGGKDSLSMLHIINQYRFYAKKKNIYFHFGAVTVDPQSAGYDPSPLKEYLKLLNVPYFFEEQDIIGAAADLPVCESICSFCSRMKRGRIYACARREGYNVVALGQHLDDIAESFLMSTFHNGYLRSMKANYSVREGDIRVIRPLIYVREKDLRNFAEKVKLPVIPENCPACFEAPKERHRMKQLLAQQEVLFPKLFKSLRAALYPLIAKSKTGLEKGNICRSAHHHDVDDDDDEDDDK